MNSYDSIEGKYWKEPQSYLAGVEGEEKGTIPAMLAIGNHACESQTGLNCSKK